MTTGSDVRGEEARTRAGRRVPGEAEFWIVIFGDLLLFSALFVVFATYRMAEPDLFYRSQPALHRGLGLLNTLFLLTSSRSVADAVSDLHRSNFAGARRRLGFAMMCGAGFYAVKAYEYWGMVTAGANPSSNDFFMLYFSYTGLHLLHVTAGMIALGLARAQLASRTPNVVMIECCALFWHVVDLVWVIIFTLFYLYR